MSKKEILLNLEMINLFCKQALNGEWDKSDGGFEVMTDLLEETINGVKNIP